MPRELVFIPPSRGLITGAVPVQPGYQRDYTADEMREWGRGLSRFYGAFEQDRTRVEGWLATPRERLSADERCAVEAHDHFLSEASRGIAGSLRPDGRVEIDKGRHRAHYLIERAAEPVPVWVSSANARELRAFRDRCHGEVARTRPQLVQDPAKVRAREMGRIALAAPEPERLPEVHVATERMERTHERGIWRPERDR